MTRTMVAATSLALLGGCALVPFRHHHRVAAVSPAPQVVTVDGGMCDVGKLKVLEGRPGSAVLAAQALDLSGARIVRWLHPGDMATMDVRADRLNIRLNRANFVKSFACG